MLGQANVTAVKVMMGHADIAAPKGHMPSWADLDRHCSWRSVSSAALYTYRDKGSHGTNCLGSTKFAHTGLLSFVLFGNRHTD